MTRCLDHCSAHSGALKAFSEPGLYVCDCEIDPTPLDLLRVRVSELYGSDYCLDMHTKGARTTSEHKQRPYVLSVRCEAPCYRLYERAGFVWTEGRTLISRNDVPDAPYQQARVHFNEQLLVDLLLADVIINAWNRLAVAFRALASGHQVLPA